jgi:cytidylate kinase
MTLVAISAAYGAGGSRVGRGLAERLGVPFLDRAIPMAVAEQLEVPLDKAAAHDEQVGGSLLERLLQGFIGSDTGVPAPVPFEHLSGDEFRRATEEVLLRQAASGGGVILGRGAVIVLREDPRVVRVRLHGPAERRLRQAMQLEALDEATAERGLRRLDRVHEDYARRFYGVGLDDPELYHLVIDSTAIPLPTCTEVIAAAAGVFNAARHTPRS